MKKIDRTDMAQKHKGKWVALKADRKTVIASGATVKSVMTSAKKKGAKNPIITRMPKKTRSFVGAHL